MCDCGNICYVTTRSLNSKNTKSCGCLNNDKRAERFKQYNDSNRQNLIGKQFGRLKVLELTDVTSNHGTNLYYKCQCQCGTITYVTGNNLKSGQQSCGCLKSKGEEKISLILLQNNILFEKQKSFDNCRFEKTNSLAKFDFYLPQYQTLIEYDGIQHYTANSTGWNSPQRVAEVQLRDKYKNEWCKQNNICLIRIPYTQYQTLSLDDLLPNTSHFIV